MKHDAIVSQGIPIHERIPIPDALIPDDSRVEIDASKYARDLCTLEPDSSIYEIRREGCDLLSSPQASIFIASVPIGTVLTPLGY